ncbi:MAG: hypothetical protein E7620_04665 [Ruminococcaceae bacterium]|nr:hypothetical protein [Oscillospiraceae bacterium]
MTNKKSLKRALLTSVMSLFLCFTMLLGTTYAWFTDTVQSANNVITTGNLDVALYYAKEYTGDTTNWQPVTETTKLFDENALYEPGFTEVVFFKVVNEGSLWLKYNMSLNIASETAGVNVEGQSFMLSDYLCADVLTPTQVTNASNREYIYDNFSNETLKTVIYGDSYRFDGAGWASAKQLAPGASYLTGLTIFMPTTVGNEVNHNGTAPTIELGIGLKASQTTKEEDSFGDNYDFANGELTVDPSNAQTAIHNAQPGDVITLGVGHYDTLVLENADGTPKNDITIVGRGGNSSATCTVGSINLNASTNVTLLNVCFDQTKAETVYNKAGNDTGYVASIVGAKSGSNTGAKGVVIDNCAFKATSTPASNYVAICFEEQGRPTSRATDIVVIGCRMDRAGFNFIRMNYMAQGTIYIKNNSIGVQGTPGHNAMNFTGNAANLVIKDNTFGMKSGFSNAVIAQGWNTEKAAIGTSRQGTNKISITITGNTFINNALGAEGRVLDLKSSYTAGNCVIEFSGNTYAGGLSGMTDATAPCNRP